MKKTRELVHLVKHAARQEMQDTRALYWGHVSSYDVDTNTVHVLIPSCRDEEDNMLEVGPIPLGTFMIGKGIGFQYSPFYAQATPTDLTKGEQVQVALHDRKNGVGAITKMAFNMNMAPPGAGTQTPTANNTVLNDSSNNITNDSSSAGQDVDGSAQLNPGEQILKMPVASTNDPSTLIKFYKDSSMRVNVELTLDVHVQQALNIIVKQGDCNLDVQNGDCKAFIEKGNLVGTVSEGNASLNVTLGSAAITTGQSINLFAGTNVDITALENVNITGANVNITDT